MSASDGPVRLAVIAFSLVPGLGVERAKAQEIDIAAAVRCYETRLLDRIRPHEQHTRPTCEPGVRPVDAYLVPGKYDRDVVVAALDGLEQLALASPSSVVRTSAATSIASAGTSHSFAGYPALEVNVVPRLLRLYQDSRAPEVKATVVNNLRWQVNRPSAAEALGEIVTYAPGAKPRYHTSFPAMAVDRLRFMGPEGEAVLRRLIAENRVKAPGIRAQVDAALERGMVRDHPDEPDATLACFEQSRRPGAAGQGCANGAIPAEAVMLAPADYPDAFVEAVSAGLARLAVESGNEHVRTDAVGFLAASGSRTGGPGRRAGGVVQRLVDIYDRGAHRAFVISVMHEQQEQSEAVAFVTRLATEPDSSTTHWPPPLQALGELRRMGPAGRAALQRIHEQGGVQHRVAQRRLQRIAEEEGWK